MSNACLAVKESSRSQPDKSRSCWGAPRAPYTHTINDDHHQLQWERSIPLAPFPLPHCHGHCHCNCCCRCPVAPLPQSYCPIAIAIKRREARLQARPVTRHPPARDPKQAPHPLGGLPELQILLLRKMWHFAKPMSM
jgi:hypothetical protein